MKKEFLFPKISRALYQKMFNCKNKSELIRLIESVTNAGSEEYRGFLVE